MVRLRAFGAYALRVIDASKMLRELVGTDPQFRTEEVQEYLRQMIVGRLGTALATAGVPMLDLAAHQQNIGQRIAGVLSEDLANVGIAVPTFIIENISVPPEVEAALDKRTQMGVVGDLDAYTRFQTANAIEDAAQNPGGGGEGIGIGLGMAVGQRMAEQLGRSAAPSGQPSPPGQGAPAGGPPRLPAAQQWFLGVEGRQEGPFDTAALAARASSGGLTPQTLVWTAGMARWAAAKDVPEVAAMLESTPPPLPPQG